MYKTRFCFSHPLEVRITGSRIKVLKEGQTVVKLRYSTGFIGKSPALGEAFSARSRKLSLLDGNTILVGDKSRTRWTFIGRRVLKFESTAPIVAYFSPLTAEDIPQPWAIDELGFVYLITEGAILNGTKLFGTEDVAINYYKLHNPYSGFREKRRILSPDIEHVRIETIRLGDRVLEELEWQSNAIAHWSILQSVAGGQPIWIKYRDKENEVELTMDTYELINAVAGSEKSLRPLVVEAVSGPTTCCCI